MKVSMGSQIAALVCAGLIACAPPSGRKAGAQPLGRLPTTTPIKPADGKGETTMSTLDDGTKVHTSSRIRAMSAKERSALETKASEGKCESSGDAPWAMAKDFKKVELKQIPDGTYTLIAGTTSSASYTPESTLGFNQFIKSFDRNTSGIHSEDICEEWAENRAQIYINFGCDLTMHDGQMVNKGTQCVLSADNVKSIAQKPIPAGSSANTRWDVDMRELFQDQTSALFVKFQPTFFINESKSEVQLVAVYWAKLDGSVRRLIVRTSYSNITK